MLTTKKSFTYKHNILPSIPFISFCSLFTFSAQENKQIERLCNVLDVLCFLTTGIAIILPTIIFNWPFGKTLQHKDFLSSGPFGSFSSSLEQCLQKILAHGFLYLEENCQTIAHEPLLDWGLWSESPSMV